MTKEMRTRVLIIFSVVLFVLVFDQVTKKLAEHYLKDGLAHYYLWDMMQLRYAENTGAWGGLGGNLPPMLHTAFLLVLPSVFLVGLFFYVVTRDEFLRWDLVAFGLILGGGLGNLIDRALYGYVIDFAYMGIGQFGPGVALWFKENLFEWAWVETLGTNIFNVADVAIMAGTIYILLVAFIRKEEPKKEEGEASEAAVAQTAEASSLESVKDS